MSETYFYRPYINGGRRNFNIVKDKTYQPCILLLNLKLLQFQQN